MKIKVGDLVTKFIEIHNEAADEFKQAFKEVGARMWPMDKARKWKDNPELIEYHKKNMKKDLKIYGRKGYINPIRRPLTVLDSYPNVSMKQKIQLDQKVDNIVAKYKEKWFKLLSSK